MAFRASNQLPAIGLALAKRTALQLKNYVAGRSAQYKASGALADSLLNLFHDLRRGRDELNKIKALPGIAAYTQEQENDVAYDVAGEFTAMVAAIQAIMDEVRSTFPTDAGGFLLEKKWSGEMYEFRLFTPVQLSALTALMDAFVALVD